MLYVVQLFLLRLVGMQTVPSCVNPVSLCRAVLIQRFEGTPLQISRVLAASASLNFYL